MFAPRRFAVLTAGAALLFSATGSTTTTALAGPYDDGTTNLPRKTSPYPGVGPASPYVQEIQTNDVVPMKNQAIIDPTDYGYLFRAGQQNTRLEVRVARGKLRFHDRGTASWKWLPSQCRRIPVRRGVAAKCSIPSKYTRSKPMLIEVWPRLGNDVVRTTRLSARFDVSVLGDKGRDKAFFGAGDDFFNGAQDADRVHGGPGRDWLRTGLADDFIAGGGGGDYLVGVAGNDVIRGGGGDDKMYGLDNNDAMYPGAGADHVACGNGRDSAAPDRLDRTVDCETVRYR